MSATNRVTTEAPQGRRGGTEEIPPQAHAHRIGARIVEMSDGERTRFIDYLRTSH